MYNSKDLNLEGEIWKDIPNYEGIYQASNYGRIRTHEKKTTFSKLHGIRKWNQRIIKPKGETYKTGYRVSLWKEGQHKDYLIARLVATTFLGESNLTVNHIDGNRFNNNINNLEWVSLTDNIRHAFNTGLMDSCCHKIKLIDKKGNEYYFISLSQCSKYLGKSKGYLSNNIIKGKSEAVDKNGNIYHYELIKCD